MQDTWVWISNLESSSNFDKYVTALYWSMSTLTTVGYGDVIPGNSTEKIMSMIGDLYPLNFTNLCLSYRYGDWSNRFCIFHGLNVVNDVFFE